ncbi:hypothetical protein AHiyo6_00480 [Arthrobacter sp. Hiyo6]|nr:hypothetical protein AHiyo6_00480 [Arthrobacter sp. Hiyo6]
MTKRSAQLAPSKVLPETKVAFAEAAVQLGISATKIRLKSAAALYGGVQTSHGKLGDVIAREMER